MNSNLWTREIMSLKIPNVSQKDVTKILIKKQGLSGFELSEILFDKFRN